jgi:hypothetical protein
MLIPDAQRSGGIVVDGLLSPQLGHVVVPSGCVMPGLYETIRIA